MGGDTTTAGAQGNASAMLHYVDGLHPAENPFKITLTPEEHERHLYFNDVILELAERRERVLTPDPIEVPAISDQLRAQHEASRQTALERGIEADIVHYEYALFGYSPWRDAKHAVQLEERIIAQLAHVETQYLERATRLTEGVTDIRQRVALLEDAITRENERRASDIYEPMSDARRASLEADLQEARASGDDNGVRRAQVGLFGYALPDGQDVPTVTPATTFEEINWGPRIHPPQELDQANSMVKHYDNLFTEYKQLEQGLFVKEPEQVLSEIVWFFALIVIEEIITAGISKYVRVSRGAVGAARLNPVDEVGRGLSQRYRNLQPSSQAKLDELYETRQASHIDEYSNTGPQGAGTAARRADTPCSAGGCAL